ncbi:MAG: hypothetical protein ACI8X5_000612 [Planctomycetota bacterium]|jgi:hypothetical protein
MPHLSQLQRDNKDSKFTIIAVTAEDKSNTLEAVKGMVEDKGDGMDYTVAWDNDRNTYTSFMTAAEQRGIPASFLIDKSGKIAWIGHPANADVPIAGVIDGTWDNVKGPAMMKAIREARAAIYRSAATDPKAALELLTAFRKDNPTAAKGLEGIHFTILSKLPDHKAETEKLGASIIAQAIDKGDSNALNGFAWNLVDPEVKTENRFLGLALKAAEHANKLTENKSPAVLDTLARVYFWQGELDKAVKTQTIATDNAEGKMKESLSKALDEYKKALKDKEAA